MRRRIEAGITEILAGLRKDSLETHPAQQASLLTTRCKALSHSARLLFGVPLFFVPVRFWVPSNAQKHPLDVIGSSDISSHYTYSNEMETYR